MSHETLSLYNGLVELQFDSKRHRYGVIDRLSGGSAGPVDARNVPSVTSVCGVIAKDALIPWAVRESNRVWRQGVLPDTSYGTLYLDQLEAQAQGAHTVLRQEAAQIGRQIHKAIETRSKASEENCQGVEEDARVVGALLKLEEWERANNVEHIESERPVYSRRLGVAGRLDAIARVAGELSLLDYKTSNDVYPEFWLQTSAYCKFYSEETGVPLVRRYLIHINKNTGEVTPHLKWSRNSLEKDYRAFRAAHTLYERLRELK